MNKKLITYAFGGLIVVAAGVATYRFGFRKSIPEGTANQQVMAILQQNDCFVCHSQQPELPFYASLPVIGSMIQEHVTSGTRFTDLQAKLADLDHVDPVTISMIDHAVSYGTMPLAEYKMIHWGTGFDSKEKSILSAWIREKRGYDGPVCPIPDKVAYDEAKAKLGEKMYNDTRISLDNTISCASCHILENGGADHADERTSEGINGNHGGIQAPTVYNSVFNIRQFWNGRAADLKEQAAGPPENPMEMGDQTWDQIVERLSQDKELVAEFEALYPGEGLTKSTVTGAIAEFEKTLLTPDSKFDLYLKGDKNALTAEELKGYEVFKQNACATCHTGVILGGQTFEYLNVFGNHFADRSSEIEYNADDDGLKGFSGKDEDLHKYKVPTLRNIALTPPYFHDGSFQTMEEAVKAMGKYELGKDLSDQDVKSIVTFMNTLTGKSPYLTSK